MRLPETSTEHDLYETAALWWNRPRDIPALVDAATYVGIVPAWVGAGNEDS